MYVSKSHTSTSRDASAPQLTLLKSASTSSVVPLSFPRARSISFGSSAPAMSLPWPVAVTSQYFRMPL